MKRTRPWPPRWSASKLKRGQAVRLETPGGGGYGPPDERRPEAVDRDRASFGYVIGGGA